MFFETVLLYIETQAGLELRETCLSLPPKCCDEGMHHHAQQGVLSFSVIRDELCQKRSIINHRFSSFLFSLDTDSHKCSHRLLSSFQPQYKSTPTGPHRKATRATQYCFEQSFLLGPRHPETVASTFLGEGRVLPCVLRVLYPLPLTLALPS